MFPCFDQPNLKGTLQLIINCPSDYTVIGNAKIDTSSASNIYRFRKVSFNETKLSPVHLFGVCAGNFDETRRDKNECNTPLGIYMRRSLKNKALT